MLRSFRSEAKGFPTKVPLPLWARPVALRAALSAMSVLEVAAKRVSPKFDPTRGLLKPTVFAQIPRVPASLSFSEYRRFFAEAAPVDGREIVDWMHDAVACAAIMDARAAEYERVGSQLLWGSGDPYIPGVRVEDTYFVSQTGATVSAQGYSVVVTPAGDLRVPAPGDATGVFRDVLVWAAIPRRPGRIQFAGVLAKWKELARTPIREAIGFPTAGDYTGPQFLLQQTGRPALIARCRVGISSDKAQAVKFIFRDPGDFTREVASFTADVEEGSNEVSFRVRGMPFVPPLVVQVEPEDGTQTRLDYYLVAP